MKEHNTARAGRVLLWKAVGVTVVLVVGMSYLRVGLYPHRIVPLTYALPLLAGLWHRDRVLLWAMAACFLVISTAKALWLVPGQFYDDYLQEFLFATMQWLDILVPAAAVHLAIKYRERVERARDALAATNVELEMSNEELAAREEEISRQNEELQVQAEELEQQTEELRSQTEELQSVNADLMNREATLHTLLLLSGPLATEPNLWAETCTIARRLFGDDASAAMILERVDQHFVVHTGGAAAKEKLPVEAAVASLIMERNETGQIEDIALRPDLRLPRGPDGQMYRSVLSAPLRFQGKPIGVVEVLSDEPRQWTSQQALLLDWLAGHCSMSLEGIRLGEELRRQHSRLQTLNAELELAKQAAEAASEAKSRFLANVSHELRTPMNAILGMVDLALERTADATAKDFLSTVKESADLLLALLNDLLDSAKIEAGRLEIDASPFSLQRVLDRTARVLAVRASEKGIQFSCHILPGTPDALVGDQVRLRQVLLNLAGNAIKFTPRGEVAVTVRALSQSEEDACLEFAVKDTGIGIPAADLKTIFQPFSQADASTTRRFGGTGLGLSISASIIALMEGRIWAESEPGQGSTFYFTVRLPLAKELPSEPEPAIATSGIVSSPLRILLVEDNPANQKLAAFVLRERGHEVETAGDGRQALELVKNNRYDVILMDLQMPCMSGLETTAVIRAEEDGAARVPIIAMTAHAQEEDRRRCLESGMDDYLSKPIDSQKMVALVERLAAKASSTGVPSPGDWSETPLGPSQPGRSVFDPDVGLERCFKNREMLVKMIQCFFEEAGSLLPQMRVSLDSGNLEELGRLAHRLKGTVVYLGADAARAAALAVESLPRGGHESAEAGALVDALEKECEALKTALCAYLEENESPAIPDP